MVSLLGLITWDRPQKGKPAPMHTPQGRSEGGRDDTQNQNIATLNAEKTLSKRGYEHRELPRQRRRLRCFLAGGNDAVRGFHDLLKAFRSAAYALRRIDRANPSEPFELGYAALALLWGGWVVNPLIDSFAASKASAAMHYLFGMRLAPYAETIWGIWFLVIGLSSFCFLLTGPLWVRRVVAGFSLVTWAFIASMYFFWEWRTTSTPIYAAIMVGAMATLRWLLHKGEEGVSAK